MTEMVNGVAGAQLASVPAVTSPASREDIASVIAALVANRAKPKMQAEAAARFVRFSGHLV